MYNVAPHYRSVWPSPDTVHSPYLYRDPDHTDYHVQTFVLAALVLEAPHAVGLLVPVCACRAVHAPPAHMGLSICADRFTLHIARSSRRVACLGRRALLGGFGSLEG